MEQATKKEWYFWNPLKNVPIEVIIDEPTFDKLSRFICDNLEQDYDPNLTILLDGDGVIQNDTQLKFYIGKYALFTINSAVSREGEGPNKTNAKPTSMPKRNSEPQLRSPYKYVKGKKEETTVNDKKDEKKQDLFKEQMAENGLMGKNKGTNSGVQMSENGFQIWIRNLADLLTHEKVLWSESGKPVYLVQGFRQGKIIKSGDKYICQPASDKRWKEKPEPEMEFLKKCVTSLITAFTKWNNQLEKGLEITCVKKTGWLLTSYQLETSKTDKILVHDNQPKVMLRNGREIYLNDMELKYCEKSDDWESMKNQNGSGLAEKLEKEKQSLQSKWEAADNEIQVLKKELNRAKNKVTTLEHELREKKQEYESKNRMSEKDLSATKNKITTLERELRELENKSRTSERSLLSARNTISNLELETSDIRSKNKQLDDELFETKRILNEKKQALDNSRMELGKMAEENKKLLDRTVALKRSKEIALEEFDNYKHTNEKLQKENSELSKDNIQLRARLVDLTSSTHMDGNFPATTDILTKYETVGSQYRSKCTTELRKLFDENEIGDNYDKLFIAKFVHCFSFTILSLSHEIALEQLEEKYDTLRKLFNLSPEVTQNIFQGVLQEQYLNILKGFQPAAIAKIEGEWKNKMIQQCAQFHELANVLENNLDKCRSTIDKLIENTLNCMWICVLNRPSFQPYPLQFETSKLQSDTLPEKYKNQAKKEFYGSILKDSRINYVVWPFLMRTDTNEVLDTKFCYASGENIPIFLEEKEKQKRREKKREKERKEHEEQEREKEEKEKEEREKEEKEKEEREKKREKEEKEKEEKEKEEREKEREKEKKEKEEREEEKNQSIQTRKGSQEHSEEEQEGEPGNKKTDKDTWDNL